MAKGVRGPNRQFPYSYEETEQLFEQYKQDVRNNIVVFPCFQDFLDRNNILLEDADNVVNNPNDKNKDLSLLIKKIIEWSFNQLFTNPNWLKKPVAAIYLSKQKVCGYGYTDKSEVKQDTKMDVNVSFGSKGKKMKDPFG